MVVVGAFAVLVVAGGWVVEDVVGAMEVVVGFMVEVVGCSVVVVGCFVVVVAG